MMAQAMLETINERHIDLILMGWKVTPSRSDFGSVVDTLVRQATCDVVLVKLAEDSSPCFNRWLVPMAGGPNSKAAIQLLPALVTLGMPHLSVFAKVFEPSAPLTSRF